MDTRTLELQKAVVLAVAQAIPSAWERIIASYEVEDRADGKVENVIVVYVRQVGGDLQTAGLDDTPDAIETAFFALHEAASPVSDDRWRAAEVTIDKDGSYKFTFSFDPPKRINGIFDHDSYKKFKNYAEIYKAEKAGS